jgi:hypothetical protein
MLGISQGRDDTTRCRYCGEKLSLLQRLSRSEYCNAQHKDAFQRDQNELALGRLQQVAVEGREAEVSGKLARVKARGPSDGEWPEEPTDREPLPPPRQAKETYAQAPVAGVEYDDEEAGLPTSPRLCGAVCYTDVAAYGSSRPAAPANAPEAFTGEHERMPESAVEVTSRRTLRPVEDQQGLRVASLEGERQERKPDSPLEAQTYSGVRFPALAVHHTIDWSEALERERRSQAGVPPLAGLIQIAGPQTLRFEPRLRRPMALPEHPAGNPVRSYTAPSVDWAPGGRGSAQRAACNRNGSPIC